MYYRVGSAAAAVCRKEQSGLNSEGCGAEEPDGLCRPPSRMSSPADKSGAWRTAIVRGAVQKRRKVCAVVRHGLP